MMQEVGDVRDLLSILAGKVHHLFLVGSNLLSFIYCIHKSEYHNVFSGQENISNCYKLVYFATNWEVTSLRLSIMKRNDSLHSNISSNKHEFFKSSTPAGTFLLNYFSFKIMHVYTLQSAFNIFPSNFHTLKNEF